MHAEPIGYLPRTGYRQVLACMLALGTLPVVAQEETRDSQIETLKRQIEQMQGQLVVMQQQLERLETTDDEAVAQASNIKNADVESAQAALEASDEDASNQAELESRVSILESSVEKLAPDVALGGAVRLNYSVRDFDDQNKDRLGDFELELFRLNADGAIGDVLLSAEWRRYNDFQAIHHAWVGYNFKESLQGQLGISQVPFGLLPFASHSFWFGGTYYLGFEDDYDTGLKFVHQPNDNWLFHFAFYKNPEYANDDRFGRYSFDLVTDGDQQNAEINQFNLRGERKLRFSELNTLDIGLSLEAGQIYNRITERKGERYALAAHANAVLGPWNVQLQGLRYDFNPENPADVPDNFVQTGAFGFPFLMAAEANVYSFNLARSFNTSFGPITGTTCYNDFTFIDPEVYNSSDSIQNVTGCSITAGGMLVYFDWITGKNMWFAGGDGIGRNATTAGEWHSRLNINFGFYF